MNALTYIDLLGGGQNMKRIRFVLLVSLAVVSAILLTTTTRTSAAGIPVGPLFQLQQQINDLNSKVADQQAQIDALNARRPDFDLQDYISVEPGERVYKATRFIKTPGFALYPHNQIFGTLKITQRHEEGKFIQRWEEVYPEANQYFSTVIPPSPFTAEYMHNVDSGGIVETGYRFYNLSGANSSTTRYEPGLLVFPFGLYAVGDMWGGAYKEEFFLVSNPEIKQYMSRLFQYAVVGIETVTVPAGTFTDCIKIARYRGNGTDRISWYAKGVGQVKVMFTHKDQTDNNTPTDHRWPDTLNGMYELESMSP